MYVLRLRRPVLSAMAAEPAARPTSFKDARRYLKEPYESIRDMVAAMVLVLVQVDLLAETMVDAQGVDERTRKRRALSNRLAPFCWLYASPSALAR